MCRSMKSNNKFISKTKQLVLDKQKVLIIIFIAIISSGFLALSRASGFSISKEVETGTLANCAKKQSDITASGGEHVTFGCPNQNELVIITPDSEFTALKTAVKSGNKKIYWDHLKSKGYVSDPRPIHIPDWSKNLTYTTYEGAFTFNPITFKAIDHTNSQSAGAQGIYMTNVGLNAYSTALRWRLDDDQANGDHAVNLIKSWVNNFQYSLTQSNGIDGRDNQVKLGSGWFVASLTKALEVIWDHPNFSEQDKQKTADWLWKAFLKEDATLEESDFEVLGGRIAGWNGRTLWLQARLNAGLVMKATGHSQADAVINDTINKVNEILPEILYYGKKPWHEVLGQPWPEQPYRSVNPNYGLFQDPQKVKKYWFFIDSAPNPPPFFVGQTQETGRDMGHNQLGTGAISEFFRTMRLNGYGDKFSSQELGDILLGLGERHAKFYNETLDEFWSGGHSSLNDLSYTWQPSEWNTLKLSTQDRGMSDAVSYEVGGSSADHGWEFLRTELKRAGYSTPQLDKLTKRLRGVSPRNSNNAAGYSAVTTANNQSWEPLFAPDYQ